MNSLPLFRAVIVSLCLFGFAESRAQQGGSDPVPSEVPLAEELSQLRLEVARLQAVIDDGHASPSADGDHQHANASTGAAGGTKTGGDMAMKGMGMGMMKGTEMKDMGMGMGMKGMMKGMGMMQQMKGGMGMQMMGRMPDASMSISALPGFPGASHLYHIGSTGFFLDHQDHVAITPSQQRKLNEIKRVALLEQSEFDRQIERAEEELWTLTSSDKPDSSAIELKLKQIGELAAKQRFAFIWAVGTAAGVLDDLQRKALTGEDLGGGAEPAGAHQRGTDSKD